MRVCIHAYPKRMWYVEEFLVPMLKEQGAEVEVWNDTAGRGNLLSCVESFAARSGDGGTWHIQDDVLPCRDFVKRGEELDGLVYGFCCEEFTDDPGQAGLVHMPDAWHSFQCVRVPDAWAREFAEWFYSEGKDDPFLRALVKLGRFDDTFFREFLQRRHATEMVTNAKPCMVEHIDIFIGGSAINEWREFWARAEWFADGDLVEELRARLKERKGGDA